MLHQWKQRYAYTMLDILPKAFHAEGESAQRRVVSKAYSRPSAQRITSTEGPNCSTNILSSIALQPMPPVRII